MTPWCVRGGLYRQLRAPVELVLDDPERELQQDVWRLAILRPGSGRQKIDYMPITQPWLRELVKQWNRQRLISHSVGTLGASVHFAAELTGVRALRVDRGDDPSALGREDTVNFLAHPLARAHAGEMPSSRQRKQPPARVRVMGRGAVAGGARAGAARAARTGRWALGAVRSV